METKEKILSKAKMPFCPGCGHSVAVRNISKAIESLGFSAKDISIVSDIGCAGLVDPLFETHSIHGLHGRSTALGTGIALGLNNSNKKVIAILGDGGATMGLQHILEAARRNIDMTVVVFNNLLFGMTGGQMSGFSTQEFKDYKLSVDESEPYDIINLSHQAGAAYSVRVNQISNFSSALEKAISTSGFSIVELSSLCTSYAMKKVGEFQDFISDEVVFSNNRPVGFPIIKDKKSLINDINGLQQQYTSNINERIGVIIAGSAGGGVQSAAKFLAQAGMLAGLNATIKGEYPITVGTGFSVAEVIISKDPIRYTGLENPNVVLCVTDDGWEKVKNRIDKKTFVILDKKISSEHSNRTEIFQKVAGKKGAALCAVSTWIKESGVLPIDALLKIVENHKYKELLQKAIFSAEKLQNT